jgi:hypothetical protein
MAVSVDDHHSQWVGLTAEFMIALDQRKGKSYERLKKQQVVVQKDSR